MTDHPTPTDEELSLALDGKADAALLARIDGSETARARLEELRDAAGQVAEATVAPLDDDTVDQLVATALDTPVAPARRAAARRRGPAPWLVGAAVIILMAAGLTLVWAGRGTDGDQVSAKFDTVGASISTAGEASNEAPEASASGDATASNESTLMGGHGSDTTLPSASSSSSPLPLVYVGAFPSSSKLREATVASLADAAKVAAPTNATSTDGRSGGDSSGAPKPPSTKAVDRCAQQLQVTLSLKSGPTGAGYGTVGDKDVLVYEFPAPSAVDGSATTLVAAVGVSACDEVVFFER